MASKLIGRVECPECGFAAAHVKQKILPSGEVDETKKPYRFCPDGCGTYFPPNATAAARLVSKMRQVDTVEKSPALAADGALPVPEAAAGAGVAKKGAEPSAGLKPKKKGFFSEVDV